MHRALRALHRRAALAACRLHSNTHPHHTHSLDSWHGLQCTRRALCHTPPSATAAPTSKSSSNNNIVVAVTSSTQPGLSSSSSSSLLLSSSSDDTALSLGSIQHVVLRNLNKLSRRRQALLWRDVRYLLSCETAARARWQDVHAKEDQARHARALVHTEASQSAMQPRSVRATQRLLAMQLATGVYSTQTEAATAYTPLRVHAQRGWLGVRYMAQLLAANATAVLQHCTSVEHLSSVPSVSHTMSATTRHSSCTAYTAQSAGHAAEWATVECEDRAVLQSSCAWLTSAQVCAAVDWGAGQLCRLAHRLHDELAVHSSSTSPPAAAAAASSTPTTPLPSALMQAVDVLCDGLQAFMHAITAHVLLCASLVLQDLAAEQCIAAACRGVMRAVLRTLQDVHKIQRHARPQASTPVLSDRLVCEVLCSQREDWPSALRLASELCDVQTASHHNAIRSTQDKAQDVVHVAHRLSDKAFATLLYILAQHEGCHALVRQLHTTRTTSHTKDRTANTTQVPTPSLLLLALAEANTHTTSAAAATTNTSSSSCDALVRVIQHGWLPQRRLSLVEYWQLLRRLFSQQEAPAFAQEGMSVRHTRWVLSPSAMWMRSHRLPYEVRASLCLLSFLQARHNARSIGSSQAVRSTTSSAAALSLEDLYVVLRLTRQMREEWLSSLVRARKTTQLRGAACATLCAAEAETWWPLAACRSCAPATSNAFLGELAAAYEDIVHAGLTRSTHHHRNQGAEAARSTVGAGFTSSFSIMHGMVARELLCLLLHRALCEHSLRRSCHGVLTALRLVMREKEAYMYIAFVPDVVLTQSATCLAVGLARSLGTDSKEAHNDSTRQPSLGTSSLVDAFVQLAPMLSSFVLAALLQYGPLAASASSSSSSSPLVRQWQVCARLVPYAPLRSRCQLELLLRVARAAEGQLVLSAMHETTNSGNSEEGAARSWQSAALAFLTQPYATHNSTSRSRRHSDDDARHALGLLLLQPGQLGAAQLLACYGRMSSRVQKMTAVHVLRLIISAAITNTTTSAGEDGTTCRTTFRELMQSAAFEHLVQAAVGCDYNNTNKSITASDECIYNTVSASLVLVEEVMHAFLQRQMWYEGLRFRQLVQGVRPDLLHHTPLTHDAFVQDMHACYVRRIHDHATLLARGLLARSALVDLVARVTRATNLRQWHSALQAFAHYIQGESMGDETTRSSSNDGAVACALQAAEQRRMRAMERQGSVQVLTRELSDIGHAVRYAAFMCTEDMQQEGEKEEGCDATVQREYVQLAWQYVPLAQLPLPPCHAALLPARHAVCDSGMAVCEHTTHACAMPLLPPSLLAGVSLTGQYHEEEEDSGASEAQGSETMLLVEWARLHAREVRRKEQRRHECVGCNAGDVPQLYTNTQPSLASQARMLAIQAMMCWPPLLRSVTHSVGGSSGGGDAQATEAAANTVGHAMEEHFLTWLCALPAQSNAASLAMLLPSSSSYSSGLSYTSLLQQVQHDAAVLHTTASSGSMSTAQHLLCGAHTAWAEALRCFRRLPSRARPDTATLRAALRACAHGRQWQDALQLLRYCTLTRPPNTSAVAEAVELALRAAVQAGAWAAALRVARLYRHTCDPQVVHALLLTYLRVGAASEAMELGYDCVRRHVRLSDRALQLLLEASKTLSAEHAATANALRSLAAAEEDVCILSRAMQEHVRQMMQACELPVEPRQLLASVHMHLTVSAGEEEDNTEKKCERGRA